MFNVHSAGGGEMMRRAADEVGEACSKESIDRPKMIAVTVLTSSDANTLRETGITASVDEQVVNMAHLTAEFGLDGVVASPREAGLVRSAVQNGEFLIVTPGVRPVSATVDDQKRVTTAADAVRAGSDYLVIGRPIMDAPDRRLAVETIVREIENETR
jgi:orotidine-5'-phosphate decarboxylase